VAPEDAATRFAMFQVARDIAAKLGKMADAFAAIEASAIWFAVDDLEEKALALKTAALENVPKEVVEAAVKVVEEAEKRVRPDIVSELLGQQALFPALADAPELGARIEAAKKREEASAADRQTSVKLATEVKKDPENPMANLEYGRFLCFRLGDWEDGLSKLLKGGDAALKALAAKELAQPKDAPGYIEIAKLWFDFAAKADETTKAGALMRAKNWYEKASGNDAPKSELLAIVQRLSEINKQLKALGAAPITRSSDPVTRKSFNSIRSPVAFESQWIAVGAGEATPMGVALNADASLSSRFKLLDGGSVNFSCVPDGRPVKIDVGSEDVVFKPAEGMEPVLVSVERKGTDVKVVLNSAGKVLEEKTLKLAAGKQAPVVSFGVSGQAGKTGFTLKSVVVNGPVKPAS
jgi:hypothetical protein